MKFQKVYKGRVESIRQSYTDAFGMRHYEVYFKGGKMLYYQRSQKQVNLIVPGNVIRFTSHKVEPDLYHVIDDVLESYNEQARITYLHYEEENRKKKIMAK